MTRARLWGFAFLSLFCACSPHSRRVAAAGEPGEVTALPTDPDAAKLLRDVARAALRAGAKNLTILGYGAASPGDRIESMVHVPKGSCALFLSRGTDSVEDLDLHIYGDDGSQFGIDESPDSLPTLLLCPDIDVRLFASARVAQGEGLVALGVQTVARRDASSVAQAVGARNFATDVVPLDEPWPGLNDALDERRAGLGGSFTDQRRVALPLDSRVPTHLTVEVPAERCLDALILPDSETSGLTLMALDEKGRIFARGDATGPRQALLLCSHHETKSVTLELRPYAGRGVAVAALSLSSGPLKSLDPAPDVRTTLVDKGQPAEDTAGLFPARSTKRWHLDRGQITSWETTLKGCSRLDMIPDGQLLDFQAFAWDESGLLVGETAGRRGTPLFTCTTGAVRLDLKATERSGELAVEVRSGDAPSPALTENPLAASRLLARAHSAGYLSLPEEIGRVTELDISPTQLGRVSLNVPASHCQTIFIGAGHGAWGLEARIIDTKNGLDVDRSIGRASLLLRACAPRGGSLTAVLELRATSGATRALWSARQERLPIAGE